MSITGSCFCGAITYRIEGTLRDARSCHCSNCRKVFSGQASAYALVKAEEFSWTSGEDRLTTYESKKDVGFQFCRTCGATLCGLYKGKVHGVTLGCAQEDLDIRLSKHIYVGDKAAWETLPDDGVPQYQEGPPENNPEAV